MQNGMSKEEIKKELEKVERMSFINQMNDHWERKEFEFDANCTKRIKELEAMLAEAEESEGKV